MLKRIQYVDDYVLDWVGRLHTPILNRIMVIITMFGTKGSIWILLCIPLVMNPNTIALAVNFIVAIGLTSALGEGLIKHIVCRKRPCHKLEYKDLVVKRPDFYSFPSGHTASSFSIFAVALLRCNINEWLVILILAILISFSRIYLRVHYLTDVLCGVVLGLICGNISVGIMNRFIMSLI